MKTPEEIKKGLIYAIEEASWVTEGGDAHDLIEAIEKAHASMAYALAYIQQLEAAQPKWISVEERLPEKPCEVLAVAKGYTMVTWYHPKTRCFENGSGMCFFVAKSEVTHWMPLPEPPEEDANA